MRTPDKRGQPWAEVLRRPEDVGPRMTSIRSTRRRSWLRLAVAVAVVAVAVTVAVGGALAWRLGSDTETVRPPQPGSPVDTATGACLLTSDDADPGGVSTWAAMRQMVGTGASSVVVQRYRLSGTSDGAAYVNTLMRLRCSTIVSTGAAARSAVAATLTAQRPKGVRFVVADRPVSGAVRLSPSSVSARAVARAVTG